MNTVSGDVRLFSSSAELVRECAKTKVLPSGNFMHVVSAIYTDYCINELPNGHVTLTANTD